MAKNGFSVMDSDMHIVEPNDLFERYLDAPYKNQAPKITRVRGQRVGVFLFEGHAFPTVDIEHPVRNVGMASRADAASRPMR